MQLIFVICAQQVQTWFHLGKADEVMNAGLIVLRGTEKPVGLLGNDDDSLTRCRQILGICLIYFYQQGAFVHKWPKREFGGLSVQAERCPRHPGEITIRRGSLIGKFMPERQGWTSPELPNGGYEDLIQMC